MTLTSSPELFLKTSSFSLSALLDDLECAGSRAFQKSVFVRRFSTMVLNYNREGVLLY